MSAACRLVFLIVCLDVCPLRVVADVENRVAEAAKSNSDVIDKSHDEEDVNGGNYTGHVLIRAVPLNNDHVTLLSSLHADRDAREQQDYVIDFWKPPTRVRRQVDFRVSSSGVRSVSNTLKRAGIRYDVINNNLQRSINDHLDRVMWATESYDGGQTSSTDRFNLNNYNTYSDIMNWLERVCNMHNSTCAVINIGRSYENRLLKVLRIGGNDQNKPAIWIDAGVHAREWIAPATALHIVNRLLNTRDRNSRFLVSKLRWYILPVANPDGYVFTWKIDRLWRKTRSRHPDPRVKCRGVDFNRNWNFHWNGPGSSSKPCSEDYSGPRPFSEPETRAVADFLLSFRQTSYGNVTDNPLVAYISLHSYGQYWLTPWGFTNTTPPDFERMVAMATAATEEIYLTSGRNYSVGQASTMLYEASGGSDDWSKKELDITYSYTVELRDNGESGFLLPASQIEPTGNEMFQALRTLALRVLQERRRAATSNVARRHRKIRKHRTS